MNIRKFSFILSIMVAAFLFIAGSVIVYFLNSESLKTAAAADANNPLNILRPFMMNRQPFNILVLGGDKVNHNSDTMLLVNFDPSTCNVNIMSIPRDTRVTIEDKYRKINFAYPHGGMDLAAQTVSELLDVKIKYYIFVDTVAFKNIIDLLGGVDIYIPADMNYDDPNQNLHIHLKEGLRHLDGDQAEQYVRFRDPNHWTADIKKYYDGSDLKRIEAQQNFLTELIKQKLTIQYLPKLNSVINTVFGNMDTNFSLSDALKLTGYISKFNTDKLNFISMPGTTLDGNPWYFLCDTDKSRGLTQRYFPCKESFVGIDEANKSSYGSDSKTAQNSGDSSKSGKKGSSTNKNMTQKNPSNSDSSLKGGQKPAP